MKLAALLTPSASVGLAALTACLAIITSSQLLLPAFAADPPTTPKTGAAPDASIAPTPRIDPAAIALLKRSQAAMLALASYRAESWATQVFDPSSNGKTHPTQYAMATITAQKPNRMRYDAWTMTVDAQGKWSKSQSLLPFTIVCNGVNTWRQYGSIYAMDNHVAPEYLGTARPDREPFAGFYTPSDSDYQALERSRTRKELLEVRDEGREIVEGVVCRKVFAHVKEAGDGADGPLEIETTWYIGPDALVRRRVMYFKDKEGGNRCDATLRRIQANLPVTNPRTVFAYVPPKGVESEEQRKARAPKLLAQGTVAPDFTAVDKDGAIVKLSDLKGKIVVVDFWATWCGPCLASMPHTQEVIKKLQAESIPVVVIAVDNGEQGDDAAARQGAFTKWVAAHPAFDALKFVYIDPQVKRVARSDFHVSSIPTQYVIDAQGVVRASFVGYGGPTGDLEKAIRAAMLPLPAR